MDRYLTGTKRKTGNDSETNKTQCSKTKLRRKYDEAYLALGLTVNAVGDEERPLCVLCLKTLAADSMRPNKLRRHLETLHPSHINKPLKFFQRKLEEYRQPEQSFVKATSVNCKATMASLKVTYRIA